MMNGMYRLLLRPPDRNSIGSLDPMSSGIR